MASRASKVPIRRPRELASIRKLFLFVVFATAQFIFFTSSMFRVQAVEVTGNAHLRDDVVRGQAAVNEKGHLFSVPLRAVEERVKGLHWVAEVAVRRYMPGRIQIRVRERTPVMAAACDVDVQAFPQRWFVLSDDGMILAPAGAPTDYKLPRVLVHTPLLVGHKLPPGLVSTVTRTLEAVPKQLAGAVQDLRADDQGQLYLTMTLNGRPVEVRLGGSERSAWKFTVLQALTQRLQAEGKAVAYIDLRYTDPAVGWVAGVAPPAETTDKAQ